MYDSPHQFDPLVPASLPQALIEKAADIARDASRLAGVAHPRARESIRELVRSMNSYYSNRIEGQSTHPIHIEDALHKQFSDKPDVARLQRVALAHIQAEKDLEELLDQGVSPMNSEFLLIAHEKLYSQLPQEDRLTEDGRVIIPGKLREETVQVGRHIPPVATSLPRFMKRMDEVYDQSHSWDRRLILVACLHHRVTWVHPFLDGNGRSARLQTHCALWPLSEGLWSPSRGLARATQDYYVHLNNADSARRGDLDGRGNLSTAGLNEWIEFFLGICQDQVKFMGRMLDLDDMKRRIEALIIFRHAHDKEVRKEAILPLYHLFAAGPLKRMEFAQMTGLGERTARSLMSKLLKSGLLVSDTASGPVRWGLPLDSLQFLFPELYPEAATKPD
ncbi:Fic family protein [Alcaligenes aquatilis]|jgi:Fic family protein|uniref:Cell filamentation protein Fic n=1 Tax=Alcaligenes faecalis TaxID=511 RepID=A0AB33CPC3_ALCFA|nr:MULTISPECIES: Fic family protein [Alcaligenes]ASR88089.1 cell filamentation protein Fic [Alcaligenes faecalis]AWG33766.1 cell filamentation protein Fic [Alcaligenes aquatilis]MCC9165003.1 Fic family protein [Alcaligenes sp. MMA]MCH4223928.1 Fic family protein [Alcaligenes faecalis]QXR36083.1 Fic family protein [Alcaligenes aquatilis]